MAIKFNFSGRSKQGRKMYKPVGAQKLADLPDYDAIKNEDLKVGTAYGHEPSVLRTGINRNTHTWLHGQEGFLDSLKKRFRI